MLFNYHLFALQGQKPSSKYVEQAKEVVGDSAAAKVADAPTINKKGGGVGRADFAPSQQPAIKAAGKADLAPKDVRGGIHIPPLPQSSLLSSAFLAMLFALSAPGLQLLLLVRMEDRGKSVDVPCKVAHCTLFKLSTPAKCCSRHGDSISTNKKSFHGGWVMC